MKAELYGSESELQDNHVSSSMNILPDKSMRLLDFPEQKFWKKKKMRQKIFEIYGKELWQITLVISQHHQVKEAGDEAHSKVFLSSMTEVSNPFDRSIVLFLPCTAQKERYFTRFTTGFYLRFFLIQELLKHL